MDCIVLGAGFTGLGAAKKLQDAGLKVQLLEARNRVGGRAESEYVNGQLIEHGTQWIIQGNDLALDIVDHMQLKLIPAVTDRSVVRVGNHMSITEISRPDALSPFETADLGQGLMRFGRLAKRYNTDSVWTQANQRWLSQNLERWVKANLRTPGGQREFLNLVRLSAAEGDLKLDQVLQVGTKDIEESMESLFTVIGGLKQYRTENGIMDMLERWAGELDEGTIILEAVVKAIDYSDNQVTVTCADGSKYQARTVINTLPPWLAQELDYTPALPAWREEVTHRTPRGNVIKAHVIYPTRWWIDLGLSGQSSVDSGAVRVTFDVSSHEDGPGVIMGFFTGAEASGLHNKTLSLRDRIFTDALVDIFGQDARQPHTYVDRAWAIEPYAMGGHGAHFSPGIWTADGQLLAENVGPVYFAGSEYASRSNGYIEGALRSAYETADHVIKALG